MQRKEGEEERQVTGVEVKRDRLYVAAERLLEGRKRRSRGRGGGGRGLACRTSRDRCV